MAQHLAGPPRVRHPERIRESLTAQSAAKYTCARAAISWPDVDIDMFTSG
jgi:hypothetical protein